MLNQHKRGITIVKVLLLAALIPYLAIAFFSLPMADDWGMAHMVRAKGFWGAHHHWYQVDGGRYVGMGATSLYALITNLSPSLYWIAPWLMIFGSFFSFYFLLFAVGSQFFSRRTLGWGFLGLTLIYIARIPNIAEGYYWLMGSTCYTLGNILVLFMAGFLILHHRTASFRRRIIYTILSLICAAAAVGVNEILMLLMLICLIAYILFLFIRKHSNRHDVLIVFMITAICSVIVITAPGNAVRGSFYPDRHQFLFSLSSSLSWTFGFVKNWTCDALILSSTLLLLPFITRVSHHISIPVKSRKWLFLFPVFWLGLIVLSFFPGFWALGGPPPERAWNLTYFVFILGWYTCVVIYTLLLLPDTKPDTIIPRHVRVAATILFLIALFGFPTTYTAFKDLIFHARPYHREVSERIETSKQKAEENQDFVIIRPLVNRPSTLFSRIFEFKDDPEYWVNANWGEYWGLKVIFKSTD